MTDIAKPYSFGDFLEPGRQVEHTRQVRTGIAAQFPILGYRAEEIKRRSWTTPFVPDLPERRTIRHLTDEDRNRQGVRHSFETALDAVWTEEDWWRRQNLLDLANATRRREPDTGNQKRI